MSLVRIALVKMMEEGYACDETTSYSSFYNKEEGKWAFVHYSINHDGFVDTAMEVFELLNKGFEFVIEIGQDSANVMESWRDGYYASVEEYARECYISL